ncbi:ribokinase [Lachnospiraceae bacterium]|nr:ribokinase [Lachnospiraceae bacterium]
MKILNFGSMNIDNVYNVDHIIAPGETENSYSIAHHCGGKGLNQSIALAKAGAPVWHAGQIGEDGKALLDILTENGVHTDFIRKVDGHSGHTIIQVDKNGQNSIILFGGANRSITRDFVDDVLSHFEKGDVLLLQNEINELPYIIEKASEIGMRIFFNPSPYDNLISECDLSRVDMFFINEVEGYQITGKKEPDEILAELKNLYPNSSVLLTLGSEGSVCQTADETCRQNIYKVKPVDTTAAGDTYTGFFIASFLEGRSIKESMALASKASAISVTREGAGPSIPTRKEVEDSTITE